MSVKIVFLFTVFQKGYINDITTYVRSVCSDLFMLPILSPSLSLYVPPRMRARVYVYVKNVSLEGKKFSYGEEFFARSLLTKP